ncbi:MAG: hypothetical protein U5N85_04290 [Arcicella sp.]|nr:hypothetical protein [Arcicella sp.]
MKKLALTIITLLFISLLADGQTIRRVNNNAGVTGANIYATIQAAHDAATAGDIIYVEPSTESYGNLDCRKRLTIIGNGYYLDQNANNSFDSRTSRVGSLIFNNGSANSVLTGINVLNLIKVNDINVTITRCIVTGGVSFGLSTNLVSGLNSRGNSGIITQCIIQSSIYGTNSSQYGHNTLISNNIIQGGNLYNLTNSVISNNIYYRGGGSSFSALFGCSVTNNILDARGFTTIQEFVNGNGTTSVGNTISNNICLGQAATPSGNGNVNFGDETITFLDANPWNTASTRDAPFQLASGSPAVGIGTGGGNAGAFGGVSPYVLSGMPAYPIITNYTTSGVGNSTTPLNVSVTVRGNN